MKKFFGNLQRIFLHHRRTLVAFFCGVAFLALFDRIDLARNLRTTDDNIIREKSMTYQYINPLLFCNTFETKEFDEFLPLRYTVEKFINQQKQLGGITNVSVYFRDMNPGSWFGIHENDKYPAASLLKVPIMIAYFKLGEKAPEIFSRELIYNNDFDDTGRQYFKPKEALSDKKSYTVNNLIQRMVAYSDNNAWRLLQSAIDSRSIADVFTDLG